MTDIVERLRDCSKYGAYQQGQPGLLMAEAANEIERLRRRLNEVDAQLTAEGRIHARECMALRAEKDAEIGRLRAALQSIANYPHDDIPPQVYPRVTDGMRNYARLILLEPKP